MKQLPSKQVVQFQGQVWDFFRGHERQMPWREQPTPYNVLVSEIMLQQTQVVRVIPKFEAFITTFPGFESLARASLYEVLGLWSGLGYNRRAKFLWQAARQVIAGFDGELPSDNKQLQTLSGIGPNTAGAIRAYVFNQPVIFVETNIRTVYFHHFFTDSDDKVTDKELKNLIEQTIDQEHPREWYWALMDYGTYLKQTVGGRLNQSKTYVKQSPLEGSIRQVRGQIVKVLSDTKKLSEAELRRTLHADDRFEKALSGLVHEGLITKHENTYSLTGAHDAR